MEDVNEKEQTYVIWLYGAIWAAAILICIPSITFSIVASILFIVLLIAAYIMRTKADEGSLSYNHSSYIIRTLWFSIFILPAITMILASIYMLPNIDDSSILPCAQPLADHIIANPEDDSITKLYGFIKPCIRNFLFDNRQTFLIATLIAALPILAYLIYRLSKGTERALKGYRVANAKSWIK